ncbi:HNH endonuclease [Nocardioides jensenii]|uniref:HNH endonuclease n=1 Tax=Nocardioides jensenii TaxID=1843 RepID=UPI00082BF26E|nr:hypothetical protein [Nocardioides jensenii]
MTSLRRTAMTRRTELRRTPMTRKRPNAQKTVAGRRKNTGPSNTVRGLVYARAGWCCEVCGRQLHDGNGWTQAHAVHHRRPRGAGGSSDPATNSPCNLLLVCGTGNEDPSTCHGLIESQRTLALANGWLVPQHGDPASTPVLVAGGATVLLTATGTYASAEWVTP